MLIPICKDYHENGMYIHTKDKVEIKPRQVTYICGCNGYGKSTLLLQIKYYIESNKGIDIVEHKTNKFAQIFSDPNKTYDYYFYDYNKDSRIYEGEMGELYSHLRTNIQSNGEDLSYRYVEGLVVLRKWVLDKANNGKTLFIFADDLDAGTSLDMINELKDIISYMIKDCESNNIEWYIIAPINSYEFTQNNPYSSVCIDARTFREKTFKTYNQYKKYVYKTREIKEKRNEVHEQELQKESSNKEDI